MRLVRLPTVLLQVSLFMLFGGSLVGCGQKSTESDVALDDDAYDDGEVDEWEEPITDLDQTPVKRQSIGNCWLYATASWAESLHKTAKLEDVNLSESYWTYWHWFDQIAGGRAYDAISTGGSFQTAGGIILRYGYMLEQDFIASEGEAEMSYRQDSALTAINESLKNGVLKDPAMREDRAVIQDELNKAWGLDEEVVDQMYSVFGKGVKRTFTSIRSSTIGTKLHKPHELELAKRIPGSLTVGVTSLKTALGEWTESSYPSWGSASSKRKFLKRVQKALHERQPAILSWYVDFNALNDEGQFRGIPETPGSQGGHLVVLEDYQVENVPGFGTLEAGVLETREDALQAALADQAEITFLRVKNSWGNYRQDRDFIEGYAGYHDLYMDYLNGPIKQCADGEDGHTDVTNCPLETAPFDSVIMPIGY